MFKNLDAELARKQLKRNELAKMLDLCEKTLSNKMNGKTEFTLSEIIKVSEIFPECSLEYLFATCSAVSANVTT